MPSLSTEYETKHSELKAKLEAASAEVSAAEKIFQATPKDSPEWWTLRLRLSNAQCKKTEADAALLRWGFEQQAKTDIAALGKIQQGFKRLGDLATKLKRQLESPSRRKN